MECLICFHKIKKKEYYHCVYCNTVVHETCYSNWWGTNGDDNNCIHCRQENGLILRNKSIWRKFKICIWRYICCY